MREIRHFFNMCKANCIYLTVNESSVCPFFFCPIGELLGFPLEENAGNSGSILGSGRSPGEGNVNPLQHSCLENPMDRGAWWATVDGVSKNQTRLK